MSDRPIRALLVSYLFPPVGGAGVGRVLKFAKYLPKYGIEPTILTAENPSVPLVDESRLSDTAGMRVIRARTLEPGYGVKRAVWNASEGEARGARRSGALLRGARLLLVPDPQVLWLPAAHWRLRRLLRAERFDVVFISGPPFSQFALARAARRAGAAVVLDYRDEWSTVARVFEMGGATQQFAARQLEPFCLRAAHAVTTATPAFRDSLLKRFSFLQPRDVTTVPNGYDPADLPVDSGPPPGDRFVVTYAGTVFRLTRPSGLLRAIARLWAEDTELAKRLDVRFIGRVVETEQLELAKASHLGVRTLGYMDHRAALAESSRSHLNLCLLSADSGAERIYPQKIFELACLGRPVLTLAPPGALTELVKELGLDAAIHPEDDGTIAAFLREQLRSFVAGTASARPPAMGFDRYSRDALAGELAKLFRRLAEPQARPSRMS